MHGRICECLLVKASTQEVQAIRKPGTSCSRLGVVAHSPYALPKHGVPDFDLHRAQLSKSARHLAGIHKGHPMIFLSLHARS